MAGKKMQVPLLVVILTLVSVMDREVEASVCADNMIYMDLCTQWKTMCQTSKFLQDKCPLTCKKCKPVDCVWDKFSKYTNCTEECGGGHKTRTRKVKGKGPEHGGKACVGSAFESIVCNAQPCPVPCKWDEFGDWSRCDKLCDGGSQFRVRVKTPAQHGGKNCTGSARETKKCNVHNCKVNCEFHPWGKWPKCTKSCNGGTQTRTRTVKIAAAHGGTQCQGDLKESQTCNSHKCPIPCLWDKWSDWDKCSLTCGGGMTTRTRNIKQYPAFGGAICKGEAAEMKVCNKAKCPKDCKWGPFSAAGDCSKSCGIGKKSRTRVEVVKAEAGGRNCTGPSKIEISCNLRPCGIACVLDVFGPWTACSKSCSEGQGQSGKQTRTRKIKTPAAFGGAPCTEPLTETKNCNTQRCPKKIACAWGKWGEWTKCTKSCGNGNQIRRRVVATLAKNGGAKCDGTNTDFKPCNEFACPENCEWNDYGAWGDCNKDCGGGTQSRVRTVFKAAKNGGKPCPGGTTQDRKCNTNACSVNCLWDKFGNWSKCTEECGGGTQTRVRSVKQKAAYGGMACSGYATESKNCNESPCKIDCALSPFSEWTPCSKSCGTGKQTRSQVIAQAARNGGKPCPKELTKGRKCNEQECPVACVWSQFSKWTPCSQNCGGGYQMRTRKIVTKADHGGAACHGCATDSRACNSQNCSRNCKWDQWKAWTLCTAKCGGGTQNRTRTVLVTSANGGQECTGEKTSFRDCNSQKCPIPCKWSAWGKYDTCTKTCGGGMHGRVRSVLQKERYGGKPCTGPPQQMEGCSMQACPICKDSPRYARFCGTWTAYCSTSSFVKGCCRKTCRLC